jgi:hypothetical protein
MADGRKDIRRWNQEGNRPNLHLPNLEVHSVKHKVDLNRKALTLIERGQKDNVLSRGLLWWASPNDSRGLDVLVLFNVAQRSLAEAFVGTRRMSLLEEGMSADKVPFSSV